MLILFLLFSKILTQEIIQLEFTQIENKTISKEKDPKIIIDYLSSNNIETKIIVGTPKTTLNLLIYFDCYTICLPNENSIGDYNKLSSKSSSLEFLDTEKNYVNSYLIKGRKSKETFTFETINNGKKKFESINFIYSSELKNNCSGILGFKFIENNIKDELKEYNFINTLKRLNIIENYYFTIKYNGKKKGEIIIGNQPHKYDKKYNINDYVYTTSKSPTYGHDWAMIFDDIKLGNISLLRYDKIYGGYFLIEKGFIECPLKMKSFFDIYFKIEIDNGNCFESDKNKYTKFFYCNNMIKNFSNLNFYKTDMNYTFSFSKEDLFEKIGDYYFFMVVFKKDTRIWNFGKIFFQKYQFVFEQNKTQIGIYTHIASGFNIGIFLIFVFGVVIIILSSIIYNRLKKNKWNKLKKAKELSENDLDFEEDNKKKTLLG